MEKQIDNIENYTKLTQIEANRFWKFQYFLKTFLFCPYSPLLALPRMRVINIFLNETLLHYNTK